VERLLDVAPSAGLCRTAGSADDTGLVSKCWCFDVLCKPSFLYLSSGKHNSTSKQYVVRLI